ncbi:MAG: hypothetical protein JO016_18120 [Actinobacteria bacterium]|nr:hypothetical protein [Actinomycetota bacterium]
MTTTTELTRTAATAAAEQACGERDRIRANLLELDQSLGKRILDGADRLTGQSAAQWETTRARHLRLWQTFLAYAAAVDRVTGLLARHRRPGGSELAELSALLTGPAVRLARPTGPLAQRDLTDPALVELTLAEAVAEMRAAYTEVAGVLTAAEAVWNAFAGPLDGAAQALAEARSRLAGADGSPVASQLAAAEAERAELLEALNTDPLAFWAAGPGRTGTGQTGTGQTGRLRRLREQVTAVAGQAAEIAALRADADARVTAAAAAAGAATTAWRAAEQARAQAAAKIAASALPPLPAPPALTDRLGALLKLRAVGQWAQLADGLAAVTQQAIAAQQDCEQAELSIRASLADREELRAMLVGYRAKAAALGAGEDIELAGHYRRARDLLWTAPCDLTAADQAVRDYQAAVLALPRRPGGQPAGQPAGRPGGREAQS